jgi:4-coumarate--CoA ligase
MTDIAPTSALLAPGAVLAIEPGPFARLIRHLCAAELAVRQRASWSVGLVQLEGSGYSRLARELRLHCAARISEFLTISDPGAPQALAESETLEALASATRERLARGTTAITFRTSGSTGEPKRVTLPAAMLIEEIALLSRIVPPARSVVAWVPAQNIYGFLFTVMLPPVLDAVLRDEMLAPPSNRVERLNADELVIGYPGALSRAVDAAATWPDGVSVVSSGAALAPASVERLFAQGLRSVVEIYGSTETSGIGWRIFERGTFLPGAAEPFTPMAFYRLNRDGETVLERRFPPGSTSDEWRAVAVQDRLAWHADGRFSVGARLDHAVQVAGTNVWPGQVARVLRAHDEVADAVVRLMRPDEGGAEPRLKAFVVPRGMAVDGHTVDTSAAGAPDAEMIRLEGSLRRHCAAHLHAEACPARYRFGTQLPMTDTGKPADWA